MKNATTIQATYSNATLDSKVEVISTGLTGRIIDTDCDDKRNVFVKWQHGGASEIAIRHLNVYR